MFARRLLRVSGGAAGARRLVLAMLASTWAGQAALSQNEDLASYKPAKSKKNPPKSKNGKVESTDRTYPF